MISSRACLSIDLFSVDTATKKVEMTFRTTDSSRKSNITLGDLQKGQKITGSVKKVEDYGLFINIDNSRLSGLCHKSQVGPMLSSVKKMLSLLLALRQQGC